jgi:hypothetical protein
VDPVPAYYTYLYSFYFFEWGDLKGYTQNNYPNLYFLISYKKD